MSPSIGIVAAGDPRDQRTWSGTPKALVEAAEQLGYRVISHCGRRDRGLSDLFYAPHVLRYGLGARRFRQYYGPVHAMNVSGFARFRASNPRIPIIHTDFMWLSPDVVGSNDFLYRDTGWYDWSRARLLNDHLASTIGEHYEAILKRVGGVFTTSEWARDSIIAEGASADRVFTVGTGVGNSIDAYSGVKDYSNGQTLCVARVRHYDKGIDLLLDGFRMALSQRSDLTLNLVVPRGSVRPEDGVRLFSDVPTDELVRLYQQSSVYAMPARNEPYGLVYLEAQLSGLAVLGSQRGAFPEFAEFGECGFIVDQLTPQAVSRGILAAHQDPADLQIKALRGQERAGRYSWSNTMSSIVAHLGV